MCDWKVLKENNTNFPAERDSGVYNIFFCGTTIYKQTSNNKLGNTLKQKISDENNFLKFKEIIENSHKFDYNHTIMGYDVENNGSYKSHYKKGFRLDLIDNKINSDLLCKIEVQIKLLKENLNYNVDKLSGDWGLHNLLYSIEDNKIYNVDIEGFYTNQCLPYWCNITKINSWLDELLHKIKPMKDEKLNQLLNTITVVKSSNKPYCGMNDSIGYHSIELDGVYYRGQRDCVQRLEYCKKICDFTGKQVLDIGCNIGGMLFPLSNIIAKGYGIDYDVKAIKAANAIKEYKNVCNLSFLEFDLDEQPLDIMFNQFEHVDVVFLYSICMWIKKWKELIDVISLNSKILFIETNGSENQQREQIDYCKMKYNDVSLIYDKSLDDRGQHNRKLYVCRVKNES